MLVFFSIILTGILGFCGLALDVGRMEARTAALQSAADAAALTAASEYQHGASNWQALAAADAVASETQNNITGATFAIQQGASSGSFATDNLALQVTISQPLSLLFLGLVTGSTTTNVKAQAVALVPPCGLFFSTPGTSSLNVGLYVASASFLAPCPVYARVGFAIDGFGRLGNGQVRSAGASSASLMQGSQSPTTTFNTPVLTDPLAYVTAPVFSACTSTGVKITTATTLSPGTYCGGLSISSATVTLQPGLYIITGGMTVSASTLTGTGVTLYFTKGGGSSFGTISMTNASVFKVSAPTDSSYGGIPGIVVFLDRNWSGGSQDFSMVGCTYQADGVIYSLKTGIYDWQTGMTATNYLNIVAANMYLFGATARLSDNYASLPGGNPLHIAASLVQ